MESATTVSRRGGSVLRSRSLDRGERTHSRLPYSNGFRRVPGLSRAKRHRTHESCIGRHPRGHVQTHCLRGMQ